MTNEHDFKKYRNDIKNKLKKMIVFVERIDASELEKRSKIEYVEDEEVKEKIIGRLKYYKFLSAKEYINYLKEPESIVCLELLSDIWGNSGWDASDFRTLFNDNILQFFVEFIMLNEGWKKNKKSTIRRNENGI